MSQEHPVDPEQHPDDEQQGQAAEHHDPFAAADAEPTEQFVGHTDADAEPTGQFDGIHHRDPHDAEPTEIFDPVSDSEPTQQFEPQQFQPQPNDPEPTMALPVSESYSRPPVFSPRGFEQPADAGEDATHASQQQESPQDREARVLREQAEADNRARDIEQENQRRRAAAEAARQRSLGTITPDDGAGPERPLPPRRSTDKWFGSLGLFVLRLVLAAILAIRGYQMITDIPATRDLLSQIGMPYLEYLPWALAVAHGLAALGLVFGLGVRVIGVCVAALAGCALALVKWGTIEVFQSGVPGFVGELEVLIAAVGFALLTLGSGGWGMDASWRHNRWRDKYGTE